MPFSNGLLALEGDHKWERLSLKRVLFQLPEGEDLLQKDPLLHDRRFSRT